MDVPCRQPTFLSHRRGLNPKSSRMVSRGNPAGVNRMLGKTLSPLVLLLGIFSSSAPAAELIIGQASVVDGDTIEVQGRRIRLFGIDAPEATQFCFDGH